MDPLIKSVTTPTAKEMDLLSRFGAYAAIDPNEVDEDCAAVWQFIVKRETEYREEVSSICETFMPGVPREKQIQNAAASFALDLTKIKGRFEQAIKNCAALEAKIIPGEAENKDPILAMKLISIQNFLLTQDPDKRNQIFNDAVNSADDLVVQAFTRSPRCFQLMTAANAQVVHEQLQALAIKKQPATYESLIKVREGIHAVNRALAIAESTMKASLAGAVNKVPGVSEAYLQYAEDNGLNASAVK